MKTKTQISTSGTKKNGQEAFPTTSGSFVPIMVIYKLPDSEVWKGFVHPYGETTEALSKENAIEQMRALTGAYQATVQEYGNPIHLVHGGIIDLLDRDIFGFVIGNKEIMEQLHSKVGKADAGDLYVEAYRD